MRSRLGTDPGFALIEALVVLAISALVVLTLAIATNMMVRGWGRATVQTNAIEALSTGLAVVRRDLAGAERIHWGDLETGGVLFSGGRNSVGVVVGRDGTGPGAGMSMVWIDARYADNGAALVRSAAPLMPDTASFTGVAFRDPINLMTGQWTFRFSYGSRTEAGLIWSDAWTDPKNLPVAIRLEVLDTRSGFAVAPPLVVPLRIDAEPGCVAGSAFCSLQPKDKTNGETGAADKPDNSGDQVPTP